MCLHLVVIYKTTCLSFYCSAQRRWIIERFKRGVTSWFEQKQINSLSLCFIFTTQLFFICIKHSISMSILGSPYTRMRTGSTSGKTHTHLFPGLASNFHNSSKQSVKSWEHVMWTVHHKSHKYPPYWHRCSYITASNNTHGFPSK